MKVLTSNAYEACDVILFSTYWKRNNPYATKVISELKEKLLKIHDPVSITDDKWSSMSLTEMSKKMYTDATEYTEITDEEYSIIQETYENLFNLKSENRSKTIATYQKEHKSYIRAEKSSAFWGFMQKLFRTQPESME